MGMGSERAIALPSTVIVLKKKSVSGKISPAIQKTFILDPPFSPTYLFLPLKQR